MNPLRRAVPLFVNPHAGTGPTGIDALRDAFGDELIAPEEVAPADLRARIQRAIAQGCDAVAVAGGDGSLHTAVNALGGSATALAIVPAGTLNNFAQRMGITDVDAAVDALKHGSPESIPLGQLGDELFLNTVTFGEYARTVRIREKLRRYMGKWPAALAGFLYVVCTLRTFDVDLEVDGERIHRRTPFVWIGIGLGSFPRVDEAIERRSVPDLEVAVLHSRTPWATAAFMWRSSLKMLRNEYPVRDPALEVFQTHRLTLHRRKPLHGTSDGELLRVESPIVISVRTDAVRIIH